MSKKDANTLDTLYEDEEHVERKETLSLQNSVVSTPKPAFMKHKDNININQAKQDIEDAKDEWDRVSSVVPVSKSSQVNSSRVTSEETLIYFRQRDMSYFLKYIKPIKQRKQVAELIRWLIGPPKLNSLLIPDRNLIFAIAQCPFDTSDIIHTNVLQTLYKSLTGSQRDCPRYGSHWENIGFQGMDPGTDLRGVGFLGLYHLLCFILNPLTTDLSREIVALSQSEMQDFPFCVMGINITRIVLETLREEALNKECNRRKDMFLVTNEFYAGLYLHLFHIWREQKKTIMDSGFVLKDLGSLAKNKPATIFEGLKNYVSGKTKSQAQSNVQCSFTDIGGITLKPSADML